MKTVEKEFIPVMLGSDINTYSMSRAFYEEYGVRSIVIGKSAAGPSCNSKIIDFFAYQDFDKQDVFVKVVNGVAEKYKEKKVILIGCGDSYVELVIKNRHLLRENIASPYVDEAMMDMLLTKIKFYEMCEKHQVDYPKTFIYTPEMGEDFRLVFDFPIILKPSNGIKYWEHEFATQKKVYRLYRMEDLKKVLKEIYAAGYDDSMIVQEFIPGEDANLRVMIGFCGQDRKVKLMSLAHVLLEEHTPHGLGNTGALINEYNEELTMKLKNFLEDVGYVGFFTFDIKYDERDGRYKILEINLRQGRSNYYVTAAGSNLARYVTEEYIYGRDTGFKIVENKKLWTVIPNQIIFKYVKDEKLLAEVKALIASNKVVNPLFLEGDNGLKRTLVLYKSHFSHYVKYKKYYRYEK